MAKSRLDKAIEEIAEVERLDMEQWQRRCAIDPDDAVLAIKEVLRVIYNEDGQEHSRSKSTYDRILFSLNQRGFGGDKRVNMEVN